MRLLAWIRSRASTEDVEQLEATIEDVQDDIDRIQKLVEINQEDIATLEDDTKRLDAVVQDLQDELTEDEEAIELEAMEQDIFKILMQASRPLTNAEIGGRMDPERSGDQVRPKINSLKKKITVIEDKQGRAKAYSIPKKVKTDYLEKGELAEIAPIDD